MPSITKEQCENAAKWWGSFLPVKGKQSPDTEYITGFLNIDHPERGTLHTSSVSSTREQLGDISGQTRDLFVKKLAERLFDKTGADSPYFDSTKPALDIKFGDTATSGVPGEITEVLKEVGQEVGDQGFEFYNMIMPGKILMTIKPGGLTVVNKGGRGDYDYIYSGPGHPPQALDKFDIPQSKIDAAPLVRLTSTAGTLQEGQWKLVKLDRGEQVVQNLAGDVEVARAGDYVLVNSSSGYRKVLTKEMIQESRIAVYACDDQGNIKTPNRPLDGPGDNRSVA